MALPPPPTTLEATLGPKAALLGEFAKFWDLDSDIDELAINEELSGARVQALLYNMEERNGRVQLKVLATKLEFVEGVDFCFQTTRGKYNNINELFFTPHAFKTMLMAVLTPVGKEVRRYYRLVEQAFKILHRQNRAQVEAALAEATVRAQEATARAQEAAARAQETEAQNAQLSSTLEKTEKWYTEAAELLELLDSANERLSIFECDSAHPQRMVSLPPGTSPNTRCMETAYGRELARKVFHDAAILLWSRHEGFEHRNDPAYWNTLLGARMANPEQSVYSSHINLYAALCKAANLFHGSPTVTHLTYNQLYDVLRRLAAMGCALGQKGELETVFGDQLDKHVQTVMDKFVA